MDAGTINTLLAEMDAAEIRLIPRLVDTWLGVGWMDEAEAHEWRRHCDAWQTFLALDQQPPKPH